MEENVKKKKLFREKLGRKIECGTDFLDFGKDAGLTAHVTCWRRAPAKLYFRERVPVMWNTEIFPLATEIVKRAIYSSK
jgi:hypothetical protein